MPLGRITKFDASENLSVPHIGWNTFEENRPSPLLSPVARERVYFVHSYRAETCDSDWSLATSVYGSRFVSASEKLEVMIRGDRSFIYIVGKGNIYATQFHPEKSGHIGLSILRSFLELDATDAVRELTLSAMSPTDPGLARRVIACLDVRANDDGDLVVTKV